MKISIIELMLVHSFGSHLLLDFQSISCCFVPCRTIFAKMPRLLASETCSFLH